MAASAARAIASTKSDQQTGGEQHRVACFYLHFGQRGCMRKHERRNPQPYYEGNATGDIASYRMEEATDDAANASGSAVKEKEHYSRQPDQQATRQRCPMA